jgi:hypothetical protein
MVRTVVPDCWTTASGLALLASPGSLSRASWNFSSLKNVVPMMLAQLALNVLVFTSDAPVCSIEFCAPPFSKPSPVKFWWL